MRHSTTGFRRIFLALAILFTWYESDRITHHRKTEASREYRLLNPVAEKQHIQQLTGREGDTRKDQLQWDRIDVLVWAVHIAESCNLWPRGGKDRRRQVELI